MIFDTNTLRIYVRNCVDEPQSYVSVRLYNCNFDFSKITSSTGFCMFSNLPTGIYFIEVGNNCKKVCVNNEICSNDIILRRPVLKYGTLTINFFDQNNEPIEGVVFSITTSGKFVDRFVTLQTGNVTVDLPCDFYSINVISLPISTTCDTDIMQINLTQCGKKLTVYCTSNESG